MVVNTFARRKDFEVVCMQSFPSSNFLQPKYWEIGTDMLCIHRFKRYYNRLYTLQYFNFHVIAMECQHCWDKWHISPSETIATPADQIFKPENVDISSSPHLKVNSPKKNWYWQHTMNSDNTSKRQQASTSLCIFYWSCFNNQAWKHQCASSCRVPWLLQPRAKDCWHLIYSKILLQAFIRLRWGFQAWPL